MSSSSPRSLQDLQTAYNSIIREINQAILPLDAAGLRASPRADAWNIRQLLDHMIRSLQPVAKVMARPKPVLTRLFGTPDDPSRAFDAIQAVYRSELDGGAVAAGPFLPDEATPDDVLLVQWRTVSSAFREVLSEWADEDLDAFQVPHPLIGMLTIREMVMFSIYHCRHHFDEIANIVK